MNRPNTLVGLFAFAGLALSLAVSFPSIADEPATKPAAPAQPAAPATPADPHKHDGANHDHKKDEKKTEKKSEGVQPGDMAPAFTLTDTDGKTVKLADLLADKDTKAVVIEWFNPGCPFIVKHHKTNTTFADLYKEFNTKGVKFVAINSSAVGQEGHGKELNAKMKKEWNIEYPILLDESGATGKAYGAKTTPHCFVIGKDGKVAYNGAIDNDTSVAKAGSKNFVKNALDETIKGTNVTEASNKPYGCSVKYSKK